MSSRCTTWGITCFNPRTPCGVRLLARNVMNFPARFQSTHSLRSATDFYRGTGDGTKVSIHALLAECDPYRGTSDYHGDCFNPRTPCGVRRAGSRSSPVTVRFQSTHSLRSATRPFLSKPPPKRFQSTHSLRSATYFHTFNF